MFRLKQPCSAVPRQGAVPIGFGRTSTRVVAPLYLAAPLGPFLRVAKVARRWDSLGSGHFRATNPRVEGRIGPLNLRSASHASRPSPRGRKSLPNGEVIQ